MCVCIVCTFTYWFWNFNSCFLNPNTILFFSELNWFATNLSLKNALASCGLIQKQKKNTMRYQLLYVVMDLVFKGWVLEVDSRLAQSEITGGLSSAPTLISGHKNPIKGFRWSKGPSLVIGNRTPKCNRCRWVTVGSIHVHYKN